MLIDKKRNDRQAYFTGMNNVHFFEGYYRSIKGTTLGMVDVIGFSKGHQYVLPLIESETREYKKVNQTKNKTQGRRGVSFVFFFFISLL